MTFQHQRGRNKSVNEYERVLDDVYIPIRILGVDRNV